MAKFVMECPACGKYVRARTGFFARKKIDCACGHVINIRAEKLSSRVCDCCGNEVVFDQTRGKDAKCPVCGEAINTLDQLQKTVAFPCAQCGISLNAPKEAATYTCPVCDCVNHVAERLQLEQIKKEGQPSVIKYEGDRDTLVWKHPVEDFNPGSQLIVHESQEAIFFRDGRALDPFCAGIYSLNPQQLGASGQGVIHSEVYFFNLTSQMAVKWGTPEKVNLLEPETGAPISLGARGMLNFRIANPQKLLLKLVGTGGALTRQDLVSDGESHIQNYFRSLIQLTVSTKLAGIISQEGLDILQLDQQKMRLSAAMLPALQSSFQEYGLVITEFLVLGIMLPQQGDLGYDSMQTILQLRQKNLTKTAIATETELKLAELEAKKQLDIRIQENVAEVEMAHRKAVAQKGETTLLETQYDVQAERLRMQLEMERKAQTAQIEAEEMQLKGYNRKDVIQADVQKAYAGALGQMGGSGSLLGDMAGLGAGVGAMGGVMDLTREAIRPMLRTNSTVAAGWDCGCGARDIRSNFCPDCGGKKPEASAGWDCPNCGCKGITAKFCGECGCRKPEASPTWDCPECGNKGITAKFCGECGHKREG